jgi:hypothetical protein
VLSQAGIAGIVGYGASLLVRLLLRRWRARNAGLPSVPSTRARALVAGARLLVDALALVTFLALQLRFRFHPGVPGAGGADVRRDG